VSLSRVYNTSLKIKRLKMDSKPLTTLAKPYKYRFREKGKKKKKKDRVIVLGILF
jgi:hypothetical protein